MRRRHHISHAFLLSVLFHLVLFYFLYLLPSDRIDNGSEGIEARIFTIIPRNPIRPVAVRYDNLKPMVNRTVNVRDLRRLSPTDSLSPVSVVIEDRPVEVDVRAETGLGMGMVNTAPEPDFVKPVIRPMERPRNKPASVDFPPPDNPVIPLGSSITIPSSIPVMESPLTQIGIDIERDRTAKLDLVFIVDASESMTEEIAAVERHLDGMMSHVDQAGIDYRIIVVQFKYSMAYAAIGRDVVISSPMTNVESVRQVLRRIKCRANERGLDALWKAANEIEFRPEAKVRFVFVTDEVLSGERTRDEVLRIIQKKGITVDVIGIARDFQKRLASSTGGIWMPISSLMDIY